MLLHGIKNLKLPPWLRYPQALRENKNLRRAFLVCAGLCAADLVLYFALAAPSAARLAEREATYAELRKRHAEALLFQKQKKAFAGIKAGISSQKDMPLLVKELVQTARKLKLSVAAVSYDIPMPGGGGLTMLSFSFPAEGAYPAVKRFIYEIETSDRLVGIQDLKLDADRGRVRLQLKLVTYIKASEG